MMKKRFKKDTIAPYPSLQHTLFPISTYYFRELI